MKLLLPLSTIAAALLASPAFPATYFVSNAADFNNTAIVPATLNAGDSVILLNGNYGALNRTLNSSISSDAVAQSNPIVVCAETPGGVVITEPSTIDVKGRGIVISGLKFAATSGILDNNSTDVATLIRLHYKSRYCVVNNVQFDCAAGDDYGSFIFVNGFNHKIEYCSFNGIPDTIAGPLIYFSTKSDDIDGITVPRLHTVRYCYFGQRICGTGNGYETIRIGVSPIQAYDMRVTVEKNVFYRSLWHSGSSAADEPEIISSKSKGNVIRFNTVLETDGGIVLRHGDNCSVYANFILGGAYYSGGGLAFNSTNNGWQAGIRITSQGQKVYNNYVYNVQGTGGRAAFAMLAGESGYSDGNGTGGTDGYEVPNNANIYNNTFVNCKVLAFGHISRTPPGGGSTIQPTGVKIYNNVLQTTISYSIGYTTQGAGFTPGVSGANYIYGPSANIGWQLVGTYSTSVSPNINTTFSNYLIPSAGNSAVLIDQADAALLPNSDIRNVTRTGALKDIGCYEVGLAGNSNHPLLRNEVGPEFDGGPAGTAY